MKEKDKISEQLSAYIDGELTDAEAQLLEQKLNNSIELQNILQELIKLKKLTQKFSGRLKDSPYFETRLEGLISERTKTPRKFVKWLPVTGIAAVTVVLMILLKLNPHLIEDIVEEQKSNIAGFYTENLKPLLFAAELTNEDIFNFAFYHELPLDETKTNVIHLGYDQAGKEFFEIRNASTVSSGKNYEVFAEALNFDDEQRKKVDSILFYYADALQSQILVDDEQTIAISPVLWNYQKAIVADILTFASNSNPERFKKLVPVNLDPQNFAEVKNAFIENRAMKYPNEYIILTPDSIFRDSFTFDMQKFKDELKEMHKKIHTEKKLSQDHRKIAGQHMKDPKHRQQNFVYKFKGDQEKQRGNDIHKSQRHFKIEIDTNYYRVELVNIDFPTIVLPDFDSINKQIEMATLHLRNLNVPIPPDTKFKTRVRVGEVWTDSPPSAPTPPDINDLDLDSLLRYESDLKDSLNFLFKNGGAFEFRMDSLMTMFFPRGKDSVLIFNDKSFKEEMQRFQEEMKKLKKEIQELRQELKGTPAPEKKSPTPVEI